MTRRPLGKSGLAVSPIALGTWAMGGHVASWGHVDDNESIATIQKAEDLGINLIDTSPIYGHGHAEEIVGKALRGGRDRWVVATKCGLLPGADADALPRRCLSFDSITTECDQSLRRLGIDCIDIYQCHWPDPETPIRETMEAMTSLLELGKIRAIGLSNFGCERMAAAREFGPVGVAQISFSMLQRRAASDLLPYCVEHEMGALAYGPLSKGLLTGKFREDSEFTDVRASDREFIGNRYLDNLRKVEQLKAIARRHDKTVAQLALNWAVHQPGVTAAIVGAKRPSQIVENSGAVGWSIRLDEIPAIDRILEEA